MIEALERFIVWTDENGMPTERAAEFIETMTRQVNLNTVLEGTGSPEGVVDAEPTQRYMDDGGVAGSILYIKKTGAGDTGWVLV